MPQLRYGVGGFSRSTRKPSDEIPKVTIPKEIRSFRVKDIILDSSHPLFKEYGEWASIGLIFMEDVGQPTNESTPRQIAYPLFPNIKHYPLKNEIVAVISLPNNQVESSNTSTLSYYLPPINIWSSQHHNAIPGSSELAPSQQKDYEQTSVGSVRKVTDGGTEINLGNTFVEQLNINPLQPFEGDYIIEGRFGQSLRFGSSEGKSPITKIRNGQGEITDEGWTTIEESINEDSGSIYLTSTQQIDLEPNIFNYNSYNTAPEVVKDYSSNQILINSGRLVLNANVDSILLSSAKSINLNSQNSVNIDSKNQVVINSPNILLGDKDATEPLLKGDTTIELLSELVDELRKWMNQFNNNPSPYLAYMIPSTTPLVNTLVKLKTDLETKTKSKVSKTI
jgi:hypothetical protein